MDLKLPAQNFDLLVPEVMELGNGAHTCIARGAGLLRQNVTIFNQFLQPGHTGSPNASKGAWTLSKELELTHGKAVWHQEGMAPRKA